MASVNLFEGQLVRLRAVEPRDWEFFWGNAADTDAERLNDAVEFPWQLERVKDWTERTAQREATDDRFRFLIETRAGEAVGTLNTHTTNPRAGTFMYGIAIARPHWRKGYGSEAIRLTLRYMFDERRYQKVTVEVYSFNEPSIRLHERLGFTLEGRLRRMLYTMGAYHDALMYGMTREEFVFPE